MKLKELFESSTKSSIEDDYYSYDHDDWIAFRNFFEHLNHSLGPEAEVVLRATDGIKGQQKSKNYNATFFTANETHVNNFISDGGYMGAYVLTHLDKFIDLRYNEEDYEYDENDEGDPHSFHSKQQEKILKIASEFYKVDDPTLSQVEDMLENPSKEFVKFLRKKGYYGMLTAEGYNYAPVYAVFNEHLKDCIEFKPWKRVK